MTADQPEQQEAPITRAMLLGILAMMLSVYIIGNSLASVSVALPAIEVSFDSNITDILWVSNAFSFAFAISLVTGGRLADMYGHRRIFFIGMAIFGISSFLGGLSPSIYGVIAAQALMGTGGALLRPAVVGMIFALLPQSRAGLAGSVIIGGVGLGITIGPLTGGALTEFLSWRWVFFTNLAIAALAMFATWKTIPADQKIEPNQKLDYAGTALIAAGLLLLLLALDQATDWGVGDPRILAALLISVTLLVIFMLVERRAGEHALIPWDVMQNRQFRSACLAVLLIAPPTGAALFYLPQFFQKFLELSPLESGIGISPRMIPYVLTSFLAGIAYNRIGGKITVLIGAGALVLSAILFALPPNSAGYVWLVPGMLVMGIGLGTFGASLTTIAVTSLPSSRTSVGGGTLAMSNYIGFAAGLALTTTVFANRSASEVHTETTQAGISLSAAEERALLGILIGTETAREIVSQFDAQTGLQLIDIARDSFIVGFTIAMLLNAALAFIGFLIVLFYVGGPLRLGRMAVTETRFREIAGRHLHRFQP